MRFGCRGGGNVYAFCFSFGFCPLCECVCWFQSFCMAHCALYVVRDNVTSIFIIIITIYK